MEEKEFPNEYENINLEELTKDLENITNAKEEELARRKENIRTFAKDVAQEMKESGGSVVKIALAEQERQREYQTIVKKSKNQRVLYLALTFVFVVGGSILLGLAVSSKKATVPISQMSTTNPSEIIFTENQIVFDSTNFSRSEFIQGFRQKVDFIKNTGMTNIVHIIKENETPRIMYGSEYSRLLATNLPESLKNTISNDFMVGIDGTNNFTPFIILSFSNFDTALSGLRDWEPFLLQDTALLLGIKTEGLSLFSKQFESEFLFNKESRVLRDENQGFVVGYTFINRNTIVITTGSTTLEEVLKRFANQSIK